MSRVACIGAGNVGRAWAVVFARAGHEVALYDADLSVVTGQALPLAARTIRDLHDAGLIADDPASVERRIRPAASIAEAVAGVAFLQESVREDLAVKQAVFEKIGQSAPPGAILASSTSAISGSSFLGSLPGPERCLVAHPVNPPSVIPLVELCGTRWTTPKTLEDACAFMAAAGMKPVTLLREIDGFLLNRLQFCLVAEALHLVGEGYLHAGGHRHGDDRRAGMALGVHRPIRGGTPQCDPGLPGLLRQSRRHGEAARRGCQDRLCVVPGADSGDPRASCRPYPGHRDHGSPAMA